MRTLTMGETLDWQVDGVTVSTVQVVRGADGRPTLVEVDTVSTASRDKYARTGRWMTRAESADYQASLYDPTDPDCIDPEE